MIGVLAAERGALARRLLLVGASAAMLLLLVQLGRWLTFWFDEWNFLLDRQDPSIETLLAPHVDHLSMVPVLLYEGLMRVAGLESYWPWLAALWACHFGSVLLLHRIAARLAGAWFGALAALSLLTLGPAFEDLLQAFQVSFLLSTMFGLLAIEQLVGQPAPRARAIATAAAALAVSTASSSVGVLFIGLILAWGILDRRRAPIIASLPVGFAYGIWYLAWHQATAGPIAGSATDAAAPVLSFLFGIGAAICAVAGLAPYLYAPLGLVVWVGVVARLAVERARPSALGASALLALAAMYALQAIFRAGLGIEHAARSGYLYPAAIFIWLAAADVFGRRQIRAVRASTIGTVAVAAIVVIALNLTQLVGSGRAMRALRVNELAVLRLISANRDVPGLRQDVSPDLELLPQVTAGRYLVATTRFGEPRLAVEPDRGAFDALVQASRLNRAAVTLFGGAFVADTRESPTPPEGLAVASGVSRPGAPGCAVITASAGTVVSWRTSAGDGFSITPPPATIRIGILPVDLADAAGLGLGGGDRLVMAPPVLADGGAWYVEVMPTSNATICHLTRA